MSDAPLELRSLWELPESEINDGTADSLGLVPRWSGARETVL